MAQMLARLSCTKTAMLRIVLAFVLVGAPAAHAQEALFFDGFESGSFAAWTASTGTNFAPSGGTCRSGPDANVVAVKITGTQAPHERTLTKALSTVGYENISLSFCFKWDVLEDGDAAFIEYTTDGTTWHLVKALDNTSVDHMMYAADGTEIAISNGVGQIPTPFTVTLDELAAHGIALPADAANQPAFALRIREHMTDGNDFVWMDDIRLSGTPLAPHTNLIPNPSLEVTSTKPGIPLGWLKGGWGANTRVFTYPVAGHDSPRGATVELTAHTGGDAKWYFQPVSVTSGQAYAFSEWFTSTIPSYVAVQYKMIDGTFTYADIAQVAAAPTHWQHVQANITVPPGAIALTVMHLIKQVGALTTDDYALIPLGTPGAFAEGMVTLTFDDNWDSVYTNALPLLNGAGFKSTQYVISDFLGTPGHMSAEDVLVMQAGGHDIGAHTKTHISLVGLSAGALATEVGGSRRDLITLGATPVQTLAYPYGDYNDMVKNTSRASGFLGARGVDRGFNTRNTDPYALRIQQVDASTTLPQVQAWVDTARADNTWLILAFHQIDHSGFAYSSTPELLQGIIDDLVAKHVSVVTIPQGIALMSPGPTPAPDTTPPTLSLRGTPTVDLVAGADYTDAGADATDNVDGDLASYVQRGGDVVDTFTPGSYHLIYTVSDLAGNSATPVTRTVQVTAAPTPSVTPTPSPTPSPIPAPTNAVSNPSVEMASLTTPSRPESWLKGRWGTNTTTFTYPAAGFEGASAVRIDVSAYTSGDAKWYFADVSATAGTVYTFADTYLATARTEPTVRFTLAGGAYQYKTLAVLPAAATPTRAVHAFTAPANTVSLTVFHLIAAVGSLTTDDFSLTY